MPRTNTTRFVILGLLGMRPSSGYEIRKDLGEVMGYFWNESFGQIYPALRRLEAERLVKRSTERNGARARHVYSITPRGRAELKTWLAEPVRPEPVRRELLLKLFFGRNVARKVLLAHVRTQRERALQLGRGVATTESQVLREANGSPDLPYWLLTIRFGKEMSRALVSWADATLAELENWPPSGAGVVRSRSGRRRRPAELATPRQRRSA